MGERLKCFAAIAQKKISPFGNSYFIVPVSTEIAAVQRLRQYIASSYMMVVMIMFFLGIFFFLLSQSLLTFPQCRRKAAP